MTVEDNGGGIPETLLPDALFQPYRTGKAEGLGIGLYMSKTLIEYNMKGRLAGENGEKGAVFTVELPLS